LPLAFFASSLIGLATGIAEEIVEVCERRLLLL
jgi:hypothetical protein